MKKERCWSLGKKFQCIPESATEIRWNNNKWEYKCKKSDWISAPIIGKQPEKYIYPTTFANSFESISYRKYLITGIIFLLVGVALMAVVDFYGYSIVDISASLSDWIISILLVMVTIYAIIFITYKIWRKKNLSF